MSTSFVYRHIAIYRSAMSVLYRGRYRRRFRDIVGLFEDDVRAVCELCFGDTIIAEWCRARDIQWTGVDMNSYFCNRARRQGFDVREGDVLTVDAPAADVFIIAGSLYHFGDELPRLLDVVFHRSRRLILSEPVRNLSSVTGHLGRWSQRWSDPGDGSSSFRYDERSLLAAIRREQARLGFTFRVVSSGRDMLIVIDRDGGSGVPA